MVLNRLAMVLVLSSAANIPRRFATIARAVAANSVVFMRKSLASVVGDTNLGVCLSISRGGDRGRVSLRQGGADAVGSRPNEEPTTPHEGNSARSRRVGKALCS